MAEIAALPLLLAAVGTVLVVAEAMAPGAHFMVFGVSLLGSGITGLILNTNSYVYLAGFAVVYGAITFYYYRSRMYGGGDSEMTSSSEQMVGRVGVVTETVTSDSGRIKIQDSFDPYYGARSHTGGEIPEGTEVEVVDPRGGNILEVESIE